MKIPLKHRYLFCHDASDSYLPVHLQPHEVGEFYRQHNDGNLEDVTGIRHHEERYFAEELSQTRKLTPGKRWPLRCRYLAWYDHKDDQYYQEMFLTFEQQRAIFGAFDDVHCPDDVTNNIEHEARFRCIKKSIKEKLNDHK